MVSSSDFAHNPDRGKRKEERGGGKGIWIIVNDVNNSKIGLALKFKARGNHVIWPSSSVSSVVVPRSPFPHMAFGFSQLAAPRCFEVGLKPEINAGEDSLSLTLTNEGILRIESNLTYLRY